MKNSSSNICFMDRDKNITSYENVKDVSIYMTTDTSYENIITWYKVFRKPDPFSSVQLFTIELLTESYVDDTVAEMIRDLDDKTTYYHTILSENEIQILLKIYKNIEYYKNKYRDLLEDVE